MCKKKRYYILLVILAFLSTISIGFATWVFSNDKFFDANYSPQAEFEFNNQKCVYDGQVHDIVYPADGNLKQIVSTNYNLPIIYDSKGLEVSEMKKAGVYKVEFTPLSDRIDSFDSISITYTISPKTLDLNYKLVCSNGDVIDNKNNPDIVTETFSRKDSFEPVIDIVSGVVTVNNVQDDVKLQFLDSTNSIVDFKTTPLYVNDKVKNNYTIKIVGNDGGNYIIPNNKFSVTINKITLKLTIIPTIGKNDYLDLAYNETERTWAEMKKISSNGFIFGNISFKDQFGTVRTYQQLLDLAMSNDSSFKISIDYMHNGNRIYGKNQSSITDDQGKVIYKNLLYCRDTDKVVASTYIVQFSLNIASADDFILVGDDIVVKLPSVSATGGTYTIEDAIKRSGNIVLKGIEKDLNSYLATEFTNILNSNGEPYYGSNDFTINGGRKLFLPYNKSNIEVNNPATMLDASKNIIYSALLIPSNKILNFENSSLVVGANVGQLGVVGQRSVIMNDGIINMKNSTLNSYGYIKGKGKINTIGNSIIRDVFRIYNFPGGANALGLYNKNIFPFDTYSFHNISCYVKIIKSSSLLCHYRFRTGGQDFYDDLIILGSYNNKNGLFHLVNNNDYMVKRSDSMTVKNGVKSFDESFNSNITDSNQLCKQRDIIDIYGDFNDDVISITVKVLGSTTISTGPDIAMPIGYMQINVKRGVGTLSKNAYKFLPGSEVNVEKGAVLNTSTPIKIYDETYSDYTYEGEYAPGTHAYHYTLQHKEILDANNKCTIPAQVINNGTLVIQSKIGGYVETTSDNSIIIMGSNNSCSIPEPETLKYGRLGSSVTLKQNTTTEFKGIIDTNLSGITTFEINKMYFSIKNNTNNNYVWHNSNEASKSVTINFYDGKGSTTLLTSKKIYIPTNTYTVRGTEFTPFKNFYDFTNNWYIKNTTNQYELLDKVNGKTINNGETLDLYAEWKLHDFTFDVGALYDKKIVIPTGGIKPQIKFNFDGTNFIINGKTYPNIDFSTYKYEYETHKNLSTEGASVNLFDFRGNRYVNNFTAQNMIDHVNNNGNEDIYLLTMFYDHKIVVNITDNNVSYFNKTYYLSNNETLEEMGFALPDQITVKNTNPQEQKYCNSFNVGAVLFDDISNRLFTKDEVLNLECYWQNKFVITISNKDKNGTVITNVTDNVFYVMPNQMIGSLTNNPIVDKFNAINSQINVSKYATGYYLDYVNGQDNVLYNANDFNVVFNKNHIITFEYSDKFVITLKDNLNQYVKIKINDSAEQMVNNNTINLYAMSGSKLIITQMFQFGSLIGKRATVKIIDSTGTIIDKIQNADGGTFGDYYNVNNSYTINGNMTVECVKGHV